MSNPIESLLLKYDPHTPTEYENALKEIIQEIALAGLARAQFFNHAAFYGGTALRIFYGLPRFSEDLDFTLLTTHSDFKLQPYFNSVSLSLHSFGFDVQVSEVKKTVDTSIESAFLKANTRMHVLKIQSAQEIAQRIPPNKTMSIKFEVDVYPSLGFLTEAKPLLPPLSAFIKILKPQSLFAGKMHAILFRRWGTRVKGRDFYDLLWYLRQKTPVQLSYLRQKMIEGKQWNEETPLTRDVLLELLTRRFNEIDWENAKADVVRFLRDPDEVAIWSAEFFVEASSLLRVEA